jgi:hypothetical protein
MRKSRGAELLRAALDETTQEAFAERVSARLGRTIHQATISSWAHERYTPRGDALIALQEIAGIEIGEWLRPPLGEKRIKKRKAA